MASQSQGGVRGLFAVRGFRRLFAGQAVSGLGDWVATLAFIALAFDLTRNQTAVAVVLILRLVPPIFAAPVGGILADRLDRRLVMVTCDLVRAALIVLVPFLGIAGLYAIAFVHECISLVFLPARDASVPVLVEDREQLPLANGFILASSFGSIPLAAGAFGGLRLAASHIPSWVPFGHELRTHPTSTAFFFDAATFLFSAWMVVRISSIPRTGSAAGEPVFKGLSEAYRYLLRTPILRSLAAGLVVSMFGGGVLFAIGIAYIKTTLHGTDVDFGWLAALWGAGMGIGLGLVRLLVRERGEPWVFLAAVTACGGILITMALLPFLWLAFGISVAFGASFSVAIMVALSMAQRVTEDRIRGRVMGGVQMLFRLGLGIGALGMGAIAYWIGRVHFIWITLDGNQVGLLAGGGLILLGAFASSGILRHAREAASASEGTSASPEAGLPSPAS
ncbi:MAG TPA: MFS transporter [Actinomycetota bacterium]